MKTDEELMSLVKAGKLDFLNELFDRYSKRVYNYFLKSTLERDESNDLTQELFIRVMKYRKSYKENSSFQVWIFQIARNMIKDHFRKMKVYNDQFNSVDLMPDFVEDDEVFQLEREKRLYRAIGQLKEEKRELLVLSKFQGLKYEQIAQIRETSVANVKVQVHRTLKELKEIYFTIEEE